MHLIWDLSVGLVSAYKCLILEFNAPMFLVVEPYTKNM